MKPISDQERIERRDRVARALASVRLEGLEPTEAARAIFDRYVAGKMSTQEMVTKIQALSAREFGPSAPSSAPSTRREPKSSQ